MFNVFEKLASPQYCLDFLAAPLGNRNNKDEFIKNQTGNYPDMSGWKLDKPAQANIRSEIDTLAAELSEVFTTERKLAQFRLELDSLKLEIKYFEQYCIETGFHSPEKESKRKLDSKTLMRLWQECSALLEKRRIATFLFKIKCVFIYRIAEWKYFKNDLLSVVTLFQKLFYHTRTLELRGEITALENHLRTMSAETKMKDLTELSMDYLRAKLVDHYGRKSKRGIFVQDDLWKNSRKVIQEYPVVLSTTFSASGSLRGVTYDYLIMDEASQVDIATGALALSCVRNAVIVGDLKQLPNVVTNDVKNQSEAIFHSSRLPQGYSFSENSFLKSVCELLPGVPQTLLREHYRCHPKIIGFCNQKFYNNDLVIMTEDHNEPDTLALFTTVAGNHQRNHVTHGDENSFSGEAFAGIGIQFGKFDVSRNRGNA